MYILILGKIEIFQVFVFLFNMLYMKYRVYTNILKKQSGIASVIKFLHPFAKKIKSYFIRVKEMKILHSRIRGAIV